MTGYRELSVTEDQMAVVTLELISDWKRWVHRRVETLSFIDENTVRRAVSVDFTLPPEITAPLPPQGGNEVYAVPLALLRKTTLRGFNLWDETGKTLPLMTSEKNGAIAAGVLAHAAEILPSEEQLGGLRRDVPRALREAFWRIGAGSATQSLKTWEQLRHPVATDDYATEAWRELLGSDADFMSLAHDLARNFLVITPLVTGSGERRIVKFSYEQAEESPETFFRDASKRERTPQRSKKRWWATEVRPDGPVGRLRVRACSVDPDGTETPIDVVLEVIGQTGLCAEIAQTGPAGSRIAQLPEGIYVISSTPPLGQLPLTPTVVNAFVSGEPGKAPTEVTFRHRPVGALAPNPHRPLKPRSRLLISLGWAPDKMLFFAPAVGQARSYHVEFEGPEGLQITRADIRSAPALTATAPQHPAPGGPMPPRRPAAFERKVGQRAHLHLTGVPQGYWGVARFIVRPRPSNIVRAAAISGTVTVVVLAIVRYAAGAEGPNAGSVVTLLLLVPGALSAYVARPREHLLATGMLFGLRMLALSQGLFAFLAAIIVVFGRRWHVGAAGVFEAGELRGWTETGLSLVLAASVAVLFVLLVALRQVSQPPEWKPTSSSGSVVPLQRLERTDA